MYFGVHVSIQVRSIEFYCGELEHTVKTSAGIKVEVTEADTSQF